MRDLAQLAGSSFGVKIARGHIALALFLSCALALAAYSGLSNLTSSIAFLHPGTAVLPQTSGLIGAVSQTLPASAGFSYFAPQVCGEYRLRMRLGNSQNGNIQDFSLELGPEAGNLVSSLASMTQDKGPAKEIATSYATFGLTKVPSADSAEVQLEVEELPLLSEVGRKPSKWIRVATYYFKR